MRIFTSLLTLILLSGCASVSISGYKEDKALAPSRTPNRVTVILTKAIMPEDGGKAAAVSQETLYLEPETGHTRSSQYAPKVPDTGKALADATNRQLLRFLPKGGHVQGLVIETRILCHQRGSRALRTLVGLGFGKTLLETKTVVFNPNKPSKEPWLEVWTTGSSNREPGAIFMAMPSPMLAISILAAAETGAAIANGSSKGLTQDAKRTGKLIGSFILEKLNEAGHPSKEQPAVKYLGSVPIPLTDQTVTVPFTKTSNLNSTTSL